MRFGILIALSTFVLASCGSDETELGSCENGVRNPITGLCPTINSNNTNSGSNNGNNNTANNQNNENNRNNTANNNNNNLPDMGDAGEDATNSGPCNNDDNDNDGLTNACECMLGTSLELADTDSDGIDDGVEDADQDCELDIGVETDPRRADTDADGANDKEEVDAGSNPILPDTDQDGLTDGIEIAGCTDPLSTDSDNDTLPDGVEDGNMDGELGTCVNRVFDPDCAQGESDPCKADTDGDGTPDQDEAQYRDCRPEDSQNLPIPTEVTNNTADYKLVVASGVTTDPITNAGVEGHVFEDTANGYTGFVLSYNSAGEENPTALEATIVSQVQSLYASAARRVSGRRITTHDSFAANVGGIIDLPDNTALHTARDQVLTTLLGATPAHGLTTNLPGAGTTFMVTEVVSRSANQAILIAAFVPIATYQDNAGFAGIRIDDLTRGPSLALSNEPHTPDCVAYDVVVRPKVDIIISLDASGSMADEQAALANFSTEFTNLLNGANIDWRIGVTSVNCSGIKTDTGLSADFRALWPAGGGFFPTGPCPSVPLFNGGNGRLVGGNFTTDPAQIASRLNSVDGTASEFTSLMAIAAMDRATPRMANDPAKLRDGAAVILIAVTDEEEEYFEEVHGGYRGLTLTAAEQAEVDMEAQPFIDYMLRPEFGATMFGLFHPPGEACDTAADVAHFIQKLVADSGGGAGSICQVDITNTLAEIANATAGIASGLRLRGTPLTTTFNVLHGVAVTGAIVGMNRSRADGYDYDPIVNRISFVGANPPQTDDRVIIPYRRWQGSVFACQSDDDCPAAQKLFCDLQSGECR